MKKDERATRRIRLPEPVVHVWQIDDSVSDIHLKGRPNPPAQEDGEPSTVRPLTTPTPRRMP
jgi:hypothetical protein